MRKRLIAAIVLAVTLFAMPLSAYADDSDRISQLEQQVSELQTRIEAMQAQIDKLIDQLQGTAQDSAETEVSAAAAAGDLTVAQQNAVRKAQSYLEFTSFSRSGLIDQLAFDGFSEDDAGIAIDSLNIDWKDQAVKKAKSYLEFSGFSHDGLVEQLKFDGFSAEDAEYGTAQNGL